MVRMYTSKGLLIRDWYIIELLEVYENWILIWLDEKKYQVSVIDGLLYETNKL
jgi:hypothetical protein